jgi:hypothetical protein
MAESYLNQGLCGCIDTLSPHMVNMGYGRLHVYSDRANPVLRTLAIVYSTVALCSHP